MIVPIKIVVLFILTGWSIIMIKNSITWLFNCKIKPSFMDFVAQTILYTIWIIALTYYFKFGML